MTAPPRHFFAGWERLFGWLLLAGLTLNVSAQPPMLTNIAAIRALPRDIAAQHLPLKVRGIVTIGSTEKNDFFFIQSEDAGLQQAIGVSIPQAMAEGQQPITDERPDHRRPGFLVEIEGVTGSGDFTPVILPKHIVNLGTRKLPTAVEPTLAELLTGSYDCQRIGMHGVVQRVEKTGDAKSVRLILAAERGGNLAVDVLESAGFDTSLLDAWVLVEGPALTYFNNRGELLSVRMMMTDRSELTVVQPPPADPFSAPLVSLDRIGAFSPIPPNLHRQRVQGVVTLSRPGEFFYLQAGNRAVRVTTRQLNPPAVGDQVEVVGFVTTSQHYAEIQEAIFRKTGATPLPTPVELTGKKVLEAVAPARLLQKQDFDGRLISLRGRLVNIEEAANQPLRLHLNHEGRIIIASFGKEVTGAALKKLRVNSEIAVRGICVMTFNVKWPTMGMTRPSGFRILLRSPDDITVVKAASWWTVERLTTALTITGLALAIFLMWTLLLRRTVSKQAARIVAEQQAKRDAEVEFKTMLRERTRLAADLHDTVAQDITAATYQLEIERARRTNQTDEAAKRADLIYELLNRSCDDLRRSLWALRTGILDGRSFDEALGELAARTGQNENIICSCQLETDGTHVPEFQASYLLLITQECVHNALKHARPKTIAITGKITRQEIRLTVTDDGQGFDPAHAPGPKEGHFGLTGMKERLKAMSGTLIVRSATGQGTQIELSIPLTSNQEDCDAAA